MKKLLFIYLSIICIQNASSQVSKNIDSTMVITIVSLDTIINPFYFDLYSRAYETGFFDRLDTFHYDYAFVTFSISGYDSTFAIKEKYYTEADSLPWRLVWNSVAIDESHDDLKGIDRFKHDPEGYGLETMLKKYSGLRSVQTLPYEKKYTVERLKRTNQIQVFADKKKNIHLVSIQLPPQ